MIRPYQTNLLPIGHFDFLDSQQQSIRGGEVVVFDTAPVLETERFSPDVYSGLNRTVLRLATDQDLGPFFYVDSDRNFGSTSGVAFENTSMFSVASPVVFAMGSNVSGKLSVFATEGFYAISTDAIDASSINVNTLPNTRLYVDEDGHLSAVPSASAVVAGFFVEFKQIAVTSGFPQRFNFAGTNKFFDSVIVYKPGADDGYLNLGVPSIAESVGTFGKIGVPTDGYYSDGYFVLDASMTIADTFNLFNQALLSLV